MTPSRDIRYPDPWAQLRFSIVGPLLAAPPRPGQLQAELRKLAEKLWRHPVSGEPTAFGFSTIERWYYVARGAPRDPLGALAKLPRCDLGQSRKLTELHRAAIRTQYREHPSWSYQLHHDNLLALARKQPELAPFPSYPTVRRFMKRNGFLKQPKKPRRETPGMMEARQYHLAFEKRSYESEYVNGLWHSDFHEGSRPLLTPRGQWMRPILLGVLDDHSRLACHLQWYWQETAEVFVHGLSQAFQKRGIPAALMTDNGSAMKAAETRQGLAVLGVSHTFTLPYSPEQNAKQENFWTKIEGRLLPMLEGEPNLSLQLLNEATQAWVELEYNKEIHSEIGCAPLRRFISGKLVGHESPGSEALRQAFRTITVRKLRRSDGTVSLLGRRFEIPDRFGHFERVHLAYASWDLGRVDLIDPRTRTILAPLYPLDKQANAEARRRRRQPAGSVETAPDEAAKSPPGLAPLLTELIEDYRSRGLPPAYLPKPHPPSRTRRRRSR